MIGRSDFSPMVTLLRIAQERKAIEKDSYICSVVRDAQIIRHHPDRTRTIERATYRYSVMLGRSNVAFLDGMNAQALTEVDIVRLIDFFEKL